LPIIIECDVPSTGASVSSKVSSLTNTHKFKKKNKVSKK
jgi:hypothetical protein